MARSEVVCINCQRKREHAAHGLCFECYRREERDRKEARVLVDRHSPGIRRDEKKFIAAYAALMCVLSDLHLSDADIVRVRGVVVPYLGDHVREVLGIGDNESPTGESEQSEQSLKSVHTPADGGAA